METFMKLTSGAITIPVERDGTATGNITFNPEDVGFAQRFYALSEGLGEKEAAYSTLLQDAALPMGDKLRVLGEICTWLRGQVELVFGEGSGQVLFGDQCSPELFRQFFAGVEPIIRRGRSNKTQKYTADSGDVME